MIRCFRVLKYCNHGLKALSPLDGRYQPKIAELSPYFSESGLMKYRVFVESQWLIHMLDSGLLKTQKQTQIAEVKGSVQAVNAKFNIQSAVEIKGIEKITNHDLKSVQYYLKKHINSYKEFLHFCCTSEDINNLAYALMLRDSLSNVVLPTMGNLHAALLNKSQDWASFAMLAHTHGQPASPTTLGKEYANFAYRLAKQIGYIKQAKIYGKFNGAVGNYNAHYFAYPNLNWKEISRNFVEKRLGLTFNPYTTQIESHDGLCRVFTQIGAFNTILIGLCRDSWEYISKGYLHQKTKEGQVGSSTMPHKVNPIDFENCEGNLGVANSLIDHFRAKLPISRQQRDLSDSTVLRNQGSALGYSMIGYDSLLKGLQKVQGNESLMKEELSNHLQVITQAIQTELRKVGYPQPYELLKNLSRGKSFNEQTRGKLLQELKGKIPDESYTKIKQLQAHTYTGEAKNLTMEIRGVCAQLMK